MASAPDPPAGRATVGYLGPRGTFSEEALLASARKEAVEPVALASIAEAVGAVLDGRVRWAIVPIENSLEGSITVTLDLLAEAAQSVRIVAESVLRVSHALIAARELEPAEIATVSTHPQVPGQCTRLLRGELAGARVLAASSTAEAVRAVVESGARDAAAIGTELAASIYGGVVLRAGVEDREDNETRFVWLARTGEEGEAAQPPLRATGGAAKTSLVFWGEGAERAGWLVRCLDEFARREINLTKIESRPRREWLGSYMFFADLEAREGAPETAAAIAGLRALCERVLVLGGYAAAPSRTTRP